LMLVSVLVGGGLVLLGMMAALRLRGESLTLPKPLPPPKPTVRSPKEEKAVWAEMQKTAKEKGYGEIAMEILPPR